MKKIIVIAVTLLLIGCGGRTGGPDLSPSASKSSISNLPDWMLSPPEKEGYRYQTATATSQDMQLALDKARTGAATSLAGLIESEWNGLIARAQEETGLDENSELIDQFKNTQEQIISKQLNDLRIAKQDVKLEPTTNGKKIYRAYALLEFDEMKAEKKLLEQVKANQKLYEKMRTTEMYEEMEDKVAEYRERYNK